MSKESIKQRSTNIELLRIISMLMILTLHYLGGGKVLENVRFGSANYFIMWTLEAVCFVSVNCYVLISGYFLVNSKFKLNKLILLWSEVFFYSIIIYFSLLATGIVHLSLKDLAFAMFPIITRKWWFASCYIALYILVPFLNIAAKAMSKTQMEALIIVSTIMLCLPHDTFNVAGGYSLIWFIFLYFAAAYLRLHKPNFKYLNNKTHCFIMFIVFSLVVALIKFIKAFILIKLKGNEIMPFFLYSYNSIFILIASIMLFMFFLKVDIKNKMLCKFINITASLTFGIYLIHAHFALRDKLWVYLGSQKYLDSPLMIFHLTLCVLLVFTVCGIIEYLRKLLFKGLKIEYLIEKISLNISNKLKDLNSNT